MATRLEEVIAATKVDAEKQVEAAEAVDALQDLLGRFRAESVSIGHMTAVMTIETVTDRATTVQKTMTDVLARIGSMIISIAPLKES